MIAINKKGELVAIILIAHIFVTQHRPIERYQLLQDRILSCEMQGQNISKYGPKVDLEISYTLEYLALNL